MDIYKARIDLLVIQQIFALLPEGLIRLDIEACSWMSFLGCILLDCFWGVLFCGLFSISVVLEFFCFLFTGTYRIFFHQVMNIIDDKQSLVKCNMFVVCLAFSLSLSVCLS